MQQILLVTKKQNHVRYVILVVILVRPMHLLPSCSSSLWCESEKEFDDGHEFGPIR